MAKRKIFRLQYRITILIAGISFLLIVLFTTIQLRNHLDKMRSYNKYRARVGTIIVKTTLEMLLKAIQSEEALAGVFRAAVSSFTKEAVVEKISILSLDGKAIATNDPLVRKFGETKRDVETYLELSKTTGRDAWFYSAINEKTQNIDIYIPIAVRPGLTYITKLSFSIGNIRDAMVEILVPITMTAIAVIIGNIILGIILLRTVVYPIRILNTATKDISSGNLYRKVEIITNDEIEELGEAVNEMTVALRKMRERAENANPVTGLPGNIAIREEVENRIKINSKFTAIHIDLDNFKAYNDRYGIAKGDDVIKLTSEILKKAMEKKGEKNDFIGHEGGDDFFVITSPGRAEAVAGEIISEFDSKIKGFYSAADRKTGYIMEKNRKGQSEKFPIMTISLAGISNKTRPIASYGELTNIAVGIKQKVKEVQKSNFLLDRRGT